MPEAAVHDGNRTGLAQQAGFVVARGHPVAERAARSWVILLPVAAGHHIRRAVLGREVGQHPERRQVHRHVRVGRGDVRQVALVVRKVGVPDVTVSSWAGDVAGHIGDAPMGTEHPLGDGVHVLVAQVGQQRLVKAQQVGDAVARGGGA